MARNRLMNLDFLTVVASFPPLAVQHGPSEAAGAARHGPAQGG